MLMVMNFPATARDARDEDSIPRLGRCPGVGNYLINNIMKTGYQYGIGFLANSHKIAFQVN